MGVQISQHNAELMLDPYFFLAFFVIYVIIILLVPSYIGGLAMSIEQDREAYLLARQRLEKSTPLSIKRATEVTIAKLYREAKVPRRKAIIPCRVSG